MSRRRNSARTRQPDTPSGGAQPAALQHDIVTGEIAVDSGVVRFGHPRAGMDLLYDPVAGNDVEFPPYWADLWPSGVELAHEVSTHDLSGVTVLELGCGLGLPSVAAALAGADVLATDRSDEAIELTTANARRNAVTVDTAQACWSRPHELPDRGPWQLVLAADVLYEERIIAWLLPLLPRIVAVTGEIWIADPQRPSAETFLAQAAERFHVSTSATRIPTVDIHRLTPAGGVPGDSTAT